MGQYRLPVRCPELGCRWSAGGPLCGGGPSLSGVILRNASGRRRELTLVCLDGGDRPYSIATPGETRRSYRRGGIDRHTGGAITVGGGQSTVPGRCRNSSMRLGKALVSRMPRIDTKFSQSWLSNAVIDRVENHQVRVGKLTNILFAAACRRRLARGLGRCSIEFGFPIAHFFYQFLIDTADGLCRQRTALGQLLSLLYHLLFAARNRHRQMRFAFDVAYLLDHSSALLE